MEGGCCKPLRLFHVSEEAGIQAFHPRPVTRPDMDKERAYVWAITEKCLPNYLTPRDCPRVAYHVGQGTTKADVEAFFSGLSRHCVAIEQGWLERMLRTMLYLYEMPMEGFTLQDEIAGYYVSKEVVIPLSVTPVDDLFAALIRRHVEIRILDTLWPLAERVTASTLNWSLCRMGNARPKEG